jgi:hypothetical protein
MTVVVVVFVVVIVLRSDKRDVSKEASAATITIRFVESLTRDNGRKMRTGTLVQADMKSNFARVGLTAKPLNVKKRDCRKANSGQMDVLYVHTSIQYPEPVHKI